MNYNKIEMTKEEILEETLQENGLNTSMTFTKPSVLRAMDKWLEHHKKEHAFYLISIEGIIGSLKATYFERFDKDYKHNQIIHTVGYDKIGMAKTFSTWMEAFEFSSKYEDFDFDIVSNIYVEDIFKNYGNN